MNTYSHCCFEITKKLWQNRIIWYTYLFESFVFFKVVFKSLVNGLHIIISILVFYKISFDLFCKLLTKYIRMVEVKETR